MVVSWWVSQPVEAQRCGGAPPASLRSRQCSTERAKWPQGTSPPAPARPAEPRPPPPVPPPAGLVVHPQAAKWAALATQRIILTLEWQGALITGGTCLTARTPNTRPDGVGYGEAGGRGGGRRFAGSVLCTGDAWHGMAREEWGEGPWPLLCTRLP